MNIFIISPKKNVLLSGVVMSTLLFGQFFSTAMAADTNDKLLTEYIQSKGPGIISFDSSNIKRYWIDHSVISRDGHFEIVLNGNESFPLKIQLANVSESKDCKIEILAESRDYSFSVLNSQSKVLSTSEQEENFIHYTTTSAVFHLEDALDFSFMLKFNSKTDDILSIKKIILSFPDNKSSSFLVSPGNATISKKDSNVASVQDDENALFSVTGKRSVIIATKKIYTTNNTITTSATIKNTGETATRILWGFAAYSKNHIKFDGRNYPYKNTSKVIKVISSADESEKIIVDSYIDYAKGCYLALNAKDDMSDIPNNTFVDGQIVEIKQMDDGHAEITLNKPLKTALQEGTALRVHGVPGAYLYTKNQVLQPGEEEEFVSEIKKDNMLLEYSSKAFSRGTYYVVPIILSYSVDANEENTILINDFKISY